MIDAPTGTALILANFTYQPIDKLTVRVSVAQRPRTVRSLDHGRLGFKVESASPAL